MSKLIYLYMCLYGIDMPFFILGFLQLILLCKVIEKALVGQQYMVSAVGSSSAPRNPNRRVF